MLVRSLVAGDNQVDQVWIRSPAGQAVRTHIPVAELVDRNPVVGDILVGHREHHIDQAEGFRIDQGEEHHIVQAEGHHIVEERRIGLLGVAVHHFHLWCRKTSRWHPKAF